MIDIARVKSLMSAASDAVEAGNYDLAIQKATAAEVLFAAMPDGQKTQEAGGAFNFDRMAITRFLANVRALRNEANETFTDGPFRVVPLSFSCEDSTCD